jgi:hypothetical protein
MWIGADKIDLGRSFKEGLNFNTVIVWLIDGNSINQLFLL